MKDKIYITITGMKHYYDLMPFAIDTVVTCTKESNNAYDCEAIRCEIAPMGIVGFVANSLYTTANGTYSAGRIYDKVPRTFKVKVKFSTSTKVICEVLPQEQKEPRYIVKKIKLSNH
ncbi:MAG: hypothetical protein RSH79_09325 [Clostridiales bacterium]